MSKRSNFLIGPNIFIKVVSLTRDQAQRLETALLNPEKIPPFTSDEFLINYIIESDDKILNINSSLPKDINRLLTPKTKVLVSSDSISIESVKQYSKMSYSNALSGLKTISSDFKYYLDNIDTLKNNGTMVRTAFIISRTVNGNYNDFLTKYKNEDNYDKLVTDSLIHIMYLYHEYQKRYKSIHGDPKIQNYTWLKLDNPVDIIYDFRNGYNNNFSRIIKRKNVQHVFYLTDLEFVYSPILHKKVFNNNTIYFNLKPRIYTDKSEFDTIYVPKITENPPYHYNTNLYGGYDIKPSSNDQNNSLSELYPKFPRMFTIDILTLCKMFLTYSYIESFSSNLSRKLNIYFSYYVALSQSETNSNKRGKKGYHRLSPSSFALLLNL